jgi:hypothetical protein
MRYLENKTSKGRQKKINQTGRKGSKYLSEINKACNVFEKLQTYQNGDRTLK